MILHVSYMENRSDKDNTFLNIDFVLHFIFFSKIIEALCGTCHFIVLQFRRN